MLTFGPVPSRRLGRSLGVNHVPPTTCSYACIYCQVGPTCPMRISRTAFHAPREVVEAAAARVASCRDGGEPVDFVTFVPDGEPTLDAGLGAEIRGVRERGVPVAVITNGSLLWRSDVRDDLAAADLVSVKVDAADERTWRAVNRPHGALRFDAVTDGVRRFAEEFGGELVTETMLVADRNDGVDQLVAVADLVARLAPARACVAAPIRPPAEPDVRPPGEETVLRAFETFRSRVDEVQLLAGEPEGTFGGAGDPVEELRSILAVHPMRERTVRDFLAAREADPGTLESLESAGLVVRVAYRGEVYVCHPIRAER